MKNMLLENLIKEQVKLVLNEILLESFKDAERIFVQQSDLPIKDIKIKLQTFKNLAKKNQIKNPKEKDIGYWIKQGFEEFNEFLSQFEGIETKTQQIKKTKSEESITAYEDDQHLVVIPLSEKASCFYGRETRWCTAATKDKNQFDNYFFRGIVLFYVINKKTGEKHAAAYDPEVDEFELFDAEDDEISSKDFPFNLDLLRNLAKKHSKQVENTKEQILNQYKGKDLSGQDLSERDFEGYNFEGTNFEKANLKDAYLYNVNLQGANLKGTNLLGTDLARANLEGVNLQGANLRGANLIQANLFRANLQGAALRGANLRGANLQEANLQGANLEGSKLTRSNLQEANLTGTNLQGTNLQGTNLQGTNLQGTNLQRSRLTGANLQGANLKGASLVKANLKKADFRGANLIGHDIEDLITRGAIVE